MQAISTLFHLWSDRFFRSRRGFWVIEEKKKSPPEKGEELVTCSKPCPILFQLLNYRHELYSQS